MSATEPDKDKTFRNYDSEAAARYASFRPAYPEQLINAVVNAHKSTGGQMDTVLDVGCGPGTATRQFAPLFRHVFGADPGSAMIEAARKLPATTVADEPVKYYVSTAEDLRSSVPEIAAGTVDLITAATAAHWFKLPGFYAAAAELLKPGGSIALWCSGDTYCDPHTTPNAAKVQAAIDLLQREIIDPFELPGNRLCHNLYEGLDLPWTLSETDPSIQAALDPFDEARFQKIYFNKDGHLEPGEKFVRRISGSLELFKKLWGTASPVTRWREAHKEAIAKGEVEDCMDRMVRVIKEALEEVPEGKGRDWVEGGSALALLVIKKKNV